MNKIPNTRYPLEDMRTVQELIAALQEFWANEGCASHHGHDVEVGAGTFNPTTFLRCLGPEPYNAAYVEPSRRPKDGRYGENPNRMQLFHQFQVILKPSPWDIQKKYLRSLEAIGMNLKEHDIRFVHDDWEQPSLGAWGLGWEVWRDGMEVTQFTYFQSVGGVECKPVTGELAYGIERLAMAVQGVNTVWELKWDETLTYGDIFKQSEKEWSHYNFKEASPEMWHGHFKGYVEEAKRVLEKGFPIPAYDFVMKASHAFNILDARGVISVTERARHIHVLRDLANRVAVGYLESREKLGYPLMREFKNHRPKMAAEPLQKGEGDFVLEIGSEELPATFVPIGCANLKHDLTKVLEGLKYDKIEVYGTPRRLVAYVSDLASVKPAEEIERKGPPVANKKAVEGFKRSVGNAKIEERDGYLFATIKTEEQLTGEILQAALPGLILGLNFPKKMHWSDLDIAYARPLQWIVALHGKCVVPFQAGDIQSGRESSAHRQICPGTFAIERAENYLSDLKAHHVMVNIEERKTSILTQLEAIKGEALSVDAVLPQVLHLTEWPILTTGTFDEEFLKAPPEVLISEMVHHQKYFPLSKDGELVNRFVITADNALTDTIREGNEKVLSARLSDGVFLFEQDSNTPLEVFNEKLHAITFREGLGTVFDKVLRIVHNVEVLGGDETAKRAARLCKADLASELVNEFPDLQGIIGRHYALGQGEDLAVATAIDEHWMPRGENAPLPTSPAGILVSLADKFDNFISCFSLGLKPTSSSDPYALRRQALGVVRILIQNEIRLPLYETIEKCYEHFLATTNQQPQKDLVREICDFFTNRIKTVFKNELTPDEIEASLSNDIYEAYCRAKALQKFRKEDPRFVQLAEVYKRAKGLLEEGHTFSEKHLQENAEKDLAKAVTDLESKLDSALKNHAYDTAYAHIAELQAPLAKFFDEVRVVVDDASLKANRQALLYRVFAQFGKLLDFGKLNLGGRS